MKHSLTFALFMSIGFIAADSFGEEKDKPRAKSVTGLVSKIDAAALTVTQRGDSGERMTTFAVGAATKIAVETNEDQVVKGGEGRERKVPKTKESKLGDVKVGDRVTVGFVEAGKADSILVLRPLPPRKKEGEK
jgi:hypothetical protein